MNYLLMTTEHIAQVAALERECFSMPWSESVLISELSNPLSLWVVAVDGDTVAGYVGSQSVMGEADMMNLAVLPSYRRQNTGRNLVTEPIRLLSEREVYSLTLEVRASNEAAIKLYDGLGFVQVGRRPNYYVAPREDALIMRKEWSK